MGRGEADIPPGTADSRMGHKLAADNRVGDFESKVVLVEHPVVPALIKVNRTTGKIYCHQHWLHGSEGSKSTGYCRSERKPRCREGSELRIWDMVSLPDTYFKSSLELKMNRSLCSGSGKSIVFRLGGQLILVS